MKLDVVDFDTCAIAYIAAGNPGAIVDPVHLCALGHRLGTGTCQGDSGGPVLQKGSKDMIVGLVSFGVQCADTAPFVPEVETRVSTYSVSN